MIIKNKLYCVYLHTNKVNQKKYVGITSKNPLTRWANGNGYKTNKPFYNAIKKYGWHDGFTHEIVCTDLTAERAAEMERELIAEYKSNDLRYGYNLTEGGFGYKGSIPFANKKGWLMPYKRIKQSPMLLEVFISLLRMAYGGNPIKETTTKITYENGVETSKIVETNTIYTEPNELAIDTILDNYSDEEELQHHIKALRDLNKRLEDS